MNGIDMLKEIGFSKMSFCLNDPDVLYFDNENCGLRISFNKRLAKMKNYNCFYVYGTTPCNDGITGMTADIIKACYQLLADNGL